MVRFRNSGVGQQCLGIRPCIKAIESERQRITPLHGLSGESDKRITAGHAGLRNDFPREVLTGLRKRAANTVAFADQGIGFGKRRGCRIREARDRQRAADIHRVVAATEAGQTCCGILVKHLHVVTAKTGFDAFAIHLMVFPRNDSDT